MGFTKRQAKAAIHKFASDRKRAAAAQNGRNCSPNVPKTSGGKRFGFALDQSLRAGLLTTLDPGNNNTIYVELKGKSFCELTVGAADETRILPAAAGYAVGTELTVILRYSDGGAATITGSSDGPLSLTGSGDLAVFVVSAIGEDTAWHTLFPGEVTQTLIQNNLIEGVAGESLEYGAVVMLESGTFRLANSIDGLYVGVNTTADAQLNDAILVRLLGIIEQNDWNSLTGETLLEPGAAYFLLLDGKYGIIPPVEGFTIRVGRAANENSLLVTFDLKVA